VAPVGGLEQARQPTSRRPLAAHLTSMPGPAGTPGDLHLEPARRCHPANRADRVRGRAARSYAGRMIGAKPAAVCWSIFTLLGAGPGDSLDDLLPSPVPHSTGSDDARYATALAFFYRRPSTLPNVCTLVLSVVACSASASVGRPDFWLVR
jgi:hypothetical protein